MWRAWIERPRIEHAHTYHETEHRKARRRPKKKTVKVLNDLERALQKKPRKTKTRSRKKKFSFFVPAGCAVCDYSKHEGITRHHLLPKAAGGRNNSNNLVRLCVRCHTRAHELFGPGDDYWGPTNRLEFITAMRLLLTI